MFANCNLKEVLGSLLSIWVCGIVVGKVDPGLNAESYGILCSIYNIAAAPPKSLFNLDDIIQIQNEVDVINASLSTQDWFEEVSQADSGEKLSEKFKGQNGEVETLFPRWKAAVTKVNEAKSPFTKLNAESATVSLARAKLKTLESQLTKIVGMLKENNRSAELDLVANDFKEAIGTCADSNTCGGMAENDKRDTVCGASAGESKGSKAGDTLIGDFLCLCSPLAASGCAGASNQACGDECVKLTGSLAGHVWSTTTRGNSDVIWRQLEAGCKRSEPSEAGLSIESTERLGSQAISNFLAAIGKGTGASGSQKRGLLGFVHSAGLSSGCTGDFDSNKGICVAYGNDPTTWESGNGKGIKWLEKFKSGLNRLPKVRAGAKAIQIQLAHLQSLRSRAEEIYEETQAAVDLEKNNFAKPTQNQTQNQRPTSSSSQATAQEPTAVNTATVPRFILLWTLLI